MKCKYCGKDLLEKVSFCVNCGSSNKNSDEVQIENVDENQTPKVEAPVVQKNTRIGVILIPIITLLILISVVYVVIVSLPPSEEEMEEDALDFANLGKEYSVTDITVTKEKGENGSFTTEVQIEAVNDDNDDIHDITFTIDYYKSGLKYNKSLNGEIETVIYPNHVPDADDEFPLPEIILNCQELGESENYSATDDAITIDIDYDNVDIDDLTAEVPLNVHVNLPNAEGDASAIAQYSYEGDYVWVGENTVSVDLQQKDTVSEELISESIKNTSYTYDGYISEELDGALMQTGDYSVYYSDMFSKAHVSTSFLWINDYVKFEGELLLSFYCEDDDWVLDTNQIDTDSLYVEWFYDIDEELLMEQLPDVIANNCSETEGISDIEIIDTDDQNGETTFTIQYRSTQDIYAFTNEIKLYYYATIFQDYQLGGVEEISSEYSGFSSSFDKNITVNYSLNIIDTVPNGMEENGTATVTLHFDESGNVHLTGSIGTIPLDNYGTMEYTSGELSLGAYEKSIYVNYALIFGRYNEKIPYTITPYLTYSNDTLTGTVYCDTISIGVDNFSATIQ